MKITVFITTILIVQVSASFYDVLQGAMLSVQNGFGKLFSDVVTDVKDTVDCTILAVEHVLALSEDATARYYEKCGNGLNNTAVNTHTKEELPQVQIAISTNEENLKKEIPEEINTTLAKLLEGYHLNDKLEDVGIGLTKETQRLVDVSKLVKEELDKLSTEINIDNKKLSHPEPVQPTVDSIIEQLKLLEAIERNLKNSSVSREVHKVIDDVLRKLNSIQAAEAVENDKVEKIMKDLESNSSSSYTELRRQLKDLQDKERLHFKLIKSKIEEHENSPEHSEVTEIEKHKQTKQLYQTKQDSFISHDDVRNKSFTKIYLNETHLHETPRHPVNVTKLSTTKTITTTQLLTKMNNTSTVSHTNITSSGNKHKNIMKVVHPANVTTEKAVIVIDESPLPKSKDPDLNTSKKDTIRGNSTIIHRSTLAAIISNGTISVLSADTPLATIITDSPFATIITDAPFSTTKPSLSTPVSTKNKDNSSTHDVKALRNEAKTISPAVDKELKLRMTTEIPSLDQEQHTGPIQDTFEDTTVMAITPENVNLNDTATVHTSRIEDKILNEESTAKPSTMPVTIMSDMTQPTKVLDEIMTTTLSTPLDTTESTISLTTSDISTFVTTQEPTFSDIIATSTVSSITNETINNKNDLNDTEMEKEITTPSPTVDTISNLDDFLKYIDRLVSTSTPPPLKETREVSGGSKEFLAATKFTSKDRIAANGTKYPILAATEDKKELPGPERKPRKVVNETSPYRRNGLGRRRIPPTRLRPVPPRYARRNRRIPPRSTIDSPRFTPPPKRYTNPTFTKESNENLPFVRSPIKNLSDFFNPPHANKDDKMNKAEINSEVRTPLKASEARRRAVREARSIIADSQRANRVINSVLNGKAKGQSVFGISSLLNSED